VSVVLGWECVKKNDDFTIRVTNLSEDTTEDDLRALCSRFGRTARTYLAKDKITGISRGFAYVSFNSRSEAETAISQLNGFGYDSLILHCEFAKPREQ